MKFTSDITVSPGEPVKELYEGIFEVIDSVTQANTVTVIQLIGVLEMIKLEIANQQINETELYEVQ